MAKLSETLEQSFGSGSESALVNTVVYDAPGSYTYTPTAGVQTIRLMICAGGGDGALIPIGDTPGAGEYRAGAGGGAGASGEYILDISAMGGGNAAVEVGEGGIGGNDGGDSSFVMGGTSIIMEGGKKGPGYVTQASHPAKSVGGAGGAVLDETLSFPGERVFSTAGQDGGYAIALSATKALSGRGGNTRHGVGGLEQMVDANVADSHGNPGYGYGTGGAGGASANGDGNQSGGNAGDGLVVIFEYK